MEAYVIDEVATSSRHRALAQQWQRSIYTIFFRGIIWCQLDLGHKSSLGRQMFIDNLDVKLIIIFKKNKDEKL